MRKYAFIVFLALFVALNSFIVYAGPIGSISAPPSVTTYNPTTYSIFNVTWSNSTATTIVNISSVKIIINGANNSMIKISGDELSGNYGYQEILGAGFYQWKSCAMDNESSESCTDNYTFTISPAITEMKLWLNGTENNRSYHLNDIANFTAQLNISGKTIYLNSSSSDWLNINNDTSFVSNLTNLSTSGLFSLTAYWIGDDNYSASSQTYYFDNIPPKYSIVSPPLSDTYGINKIHWFNVSISAATIDKVLFEFNGTSNYTANGILGNYWYSETDLPVGNYTYRWLINNSLNLKNSTGTINYNVSKSTPSIIVIPNPSWSITYGVQTNITCYNTTPYQSSSIKLYRGSNLFSGINSTSETTTLSEGTYNYTCTIDESQNFTPTSIYNTLTVSPATLTTNNNNQNTNTNQQAAASGKFTLTASSSSVTIEPGSSKVITLTLNNTLSSGYVLNINVSVSGINSTWYSLDKTSIAKIKTPGSDTVALTLNVPTNAEAKTYTITVTASGKDFTFNPIPRQATITLTVAKEETPTNITEETNETANQTLGETSANETSQSGFLTGLSINPGDFRNTVLFVGLLIAGLIFIFRSNITSFIKKGKLPMVKTYHRYSFFYSVKNKLSSLGHGIAIRLKIR